MTEEEKKKILVYSAAILVFGVIPYYLIRKHNQLDSGLNKVKTNKHLIMKTIRFFTPILWVTITLFLFGFIFDIMNLSNTVSFTLCVLGVTVIAYTSWRTRLGLNLINKINQLITKKTK